MNGADADELDNQRKARQPSTALDLRPRSTPVGGGAISKQDEVQRRLVQGLGRCGRHVGLVTAGDCFGTT
jgi:hypothetical protein